MKVGNSDWELLNSYADGELAPDEATDFERRLANEPTLASELARVMALKKSLSALRPGSAEEPRETTLLRQPMHRRYLAAAVVVLCVLAAGAGYGLLGLNKNQATGIDEIHAAFSDRTYFVDVKRDVRVSAGTSIGELDAPDLSASNLALVDMRTFAGTARIALHYRGPRGCRVTLVVDIAKSAPFATLTPGALLYRWQTRTRRFALIAEGMDEKRFAAIGAFAEASSRASERRKDFRTALIERTEKARPCA